VRSDPSSSRRRSSPSRAETRSRSPSGSQSTQHGNAGACRITSRFPARSTAMTSGGPQSENHRRSWCHRGCSHQRRSRSSRPGAQAAKTRWMASCPARFFRRLTKISLHRAHAVTRRSTDRIDAGLTPESARPPTGTLTARCPALLVAAMRRQTRCSDPVSYVHVVDPCVIHRVWIITEADRSVTTILLPDTTD
jgi:hypothetical protein